MATDPRTWVLHQDESLLVIDKPAGLPALPDGYDAAAPHLKSALEPWFGRLWTVHRLDRQTSGVLLLARSARAHRELNRQFQGRRVDKVYHALVAGEPLWTEKLVERPLRPDGDRRHRTVVDASAGKPAATRLEVLERFSGFCLLAARPQTGRTHQIRVHLCAERLPILCDSLYGGGERLLRATSPGGKGEGIGPGVELLDRPALHARALTFDHPLSGERLTFEAAYPADFSAALHALRTAPAGSIFLAGGPGDR